MDEILPEELLFRAYNRMIDLILDDSHLLNREVVEINIIGENGDTYCVLFRDKGFFHDFVGVSKMF